MSGRRRQRPSFVKLNGSHSRRLLMTQYACGLVDTRRVRCRPSNADPADLVRHRHASIQTGSVYPKSESGAARRLIGVRCPTSGLTAAATPRALFHRVSATGHDAVVAHPEFL